MAKKAKRGKCVVKIVRASTADRWIIDTLDALEEVKHSRVGNARPLMKLWAKALRTSAAGDSSLVSLYEDVFQYLQDFLFSVRTFAEHEKTLGRLPEVVDAFTIRHEKAVL